MVLHNLPDARANIITKLARWYAVEISGIMIEGGIFICLIYLIYNLKMQLKSKVKVMLLFGTRILYV